MNFRSHPALHLVYPRSVYGILQALTIFSNRREHELSLVCIGERIDELQ